jgi:two-component system, cell cycle response regulator
MPAARILVVDDNPANLKLASRVLQSDGYLVEQASTAEDALERIRRQAPDLNLPDLILMDIELPGMDGLSLTRALKADAATRNIPVVALTAFAMKGDEQRAREAGCVGYLSKPVDTRKLSAQVAEFIVPKIKVLIAGYGDAAAPSSVNLAWVMLATAGHEVAVAGTSAKAFTVASQSRPQLIVAVDFKSPGESLALIRQLRQEPATGHIPIVAISAGPGACTQEEAVAAGCTAFFAEPVDGEALLRLAAGIAEERSASVRARRAGGAHSGSAR